MDEHNYAIHVASFKTRLTNIHLIPLFLIILHLVLVGNLLSCIVACYPWLNQVTLYVPKLVLTTNPHTSKFKNLHENGDTFSSCLPFSTEVIVDPNPLILASSSIRERLI